MKFSVNNEYGLTFDQLKSKFQNVSLPVDQEIHDENLGISTYKETPQPIYDLLTQTVRELPPVDGKQVWEIVALPANLAQENIEKAARSLQQYYTDQIQARLDSFAFERGYDGVNSISKYQNIPDAMIAALPAEQAAIVTQYKAESNFVALKTAQTWAVATSILNAIKNNERPAPSDFSEIEQELPELNWGDM